MDKQKTFTKTFIGKKTKEWIKVRAELKKKFYNWGVTSCELRMEGCWIDNALGFAHKDKRRFLSHDELYEVILICNNCHNRIECLPRDQMRAIVITAIKSREELLKF